MERASTLAYWRGQISAFMRRWLVPVIATGAAGGLAAFLVSQAIAPEYRATAQLYLTPSSSSASSFQDVTLGQTLARNYVQLVKAEGVLRAAMRNTGWEGDIERFRERTQVAQVSDTSIINLSFRDRDPEKAADAANAIAQAFIDQTRSLEASLQGTTASQLDEQIRSVAADIQSLDEQIAPLRASTTASPSPGQESAQAEQQARLLTLDGLRQSKQQTLAQLVRARDDIRLSAARSRNTLSLWQPAIPPRRPDTPNVVLNTALGGISGALLALLALGVVRYRDDRITDVDAVAERLGISPIAEIPLGRRPESLEGKLFVRDEPRSAEAEAFRSLRTNITFANIDHRRPHVMLVTSAISLEGKSVVSANLALAFADAGTPTILVDADLRRPSQHDLFQIKQTPGLTNLLVGTVPMDAVEQHVWTNLILIPSGPLPANPAEALSSERLPALLQELSERAKNGAVIIDASPLLTVTDAATLATKVDGCIVVVDAARTQARVARRAIEVLRQVRAPVLGVCLNRTTGREGASYHRYPAAKTAHRKQTQMGAK